MTMKTFITSLLFAGFVGCSTAPVPAFARDIALDQADQIESWAPEVSCLAQTEFYRSGVVEGNAGYGRGIKEIKPEFKELIEHHANLPYDNMWAFGWDKYNAHEQEYMQERVFQGWDDIKLLKQKKAEHQEQITKEDINKLVGIWYDQCVAKRKEQDAAPKTKVNFFEKVASSQGITTLPLKTCIQINEDLGIIREHLDEDIPEEDITKHAEMAPDLLSDEDRMKRVLRMIKEAYAWEGSWEEFRQKELKYCNPID